MKRHIVGVDIGGTTFSSALFNENLDVLKISQKKLISEVQILQVGNLIQR